MIAYQEDYNQLAYYTLSHHSNDFIHQHIVDAFGAQHADHSTKAIRIVFALAGLYLYLECGYTGKEVQNAHMKMAQRRKHWPSIQLPNERGTMSARDVLKLPPGDARDDMIHAWCRSVWNAYHESQRDIMALVDSVLNQKS